MGFPETPSQILGRKNLAAQKTNQILRRESELRLSWGFWKPRRKIH